MPAKRVALGKHVTHSRRRFQIQPGVMVDDMDFPAHKLEIHRPRVLRAPQVPARPHRHAPVPWEIHHPPARLRRVDEFREDRPRHRSHEAFRQGCRELREPRQPFRQRYLVIPQPLPVRERVARLHLRLHEIRPRLLIELLDVSLERVGAIQPPREKIQVEVRLGHVLRPGRHRPLCQVPQVPALATHPRGFNEHRALLGRWQRAGHDFLRAHRVLVLDRSPLGYVQPLVGAAPRIHPAEDGARLVVRLAAHLHRKLGIIRFDDLEHFPQ